METATVVQTRHNPHTSALTPAQIRAQRRSQTLTDFERSQTRHEAEVYNADPCGGSPHRY